MADYWLKLYIEILDDPKMATLPDRLWRRIIEVFLVAKKINKAGHIPDTRAVAWMLRMNPDELENDMTQISTTGIIVREVNGWFIPKFEARQGAVPGSERLAQFRERKQKQEYYGDETDLKRNVTQRQSQRTESEQSRENDPPAPFDILKRTVETRGILLSGEGDIKALIEIVNTGATSEDVLEGIDWKSANNSGKPVRYISQIVGPTKIALARRLQTTSHKTKTYLDADGHKVEVPV